MARENSEHPSSRSSAIKIAVAIAALVAAGTFAAYNWIGSKEVEQPDTAESASTFVCLECKHTFDLTPAAYVELNRSGDIQVMNGSETRGRRWVRCPQCQKFAAVLADRCPRDNTAVPRYGKDNKIGRCPQCNWTSLGR